MTVDSESEATGLDADADARKQVVRKAVATDFYVDLVRQSTFVFDPFWHTRSMLYKGHLISASFRGICFFGNKLGQRSNYVNDQG